MSILTTHFLFYAKEDIYSHSSIGWKNFFNINFNLSWKIQISWAIVYFCYYKKQTNNHQILFLFLFTCYSIWNRIDYNYWSKDYGTWCHKISSFKSKIKKYMKNIIAQVWYMYSSSEADQSINQRFKYIFAGTCKILKKLISVTYRYVTLFVCLFVCVTVIKITILYELISGVSSIYFVFYWYIHYRLSIYLYVLVFCKSRMKTILFISHPYLAWNWHVRGHPLSTFAKFSKKLTFLTPWYEGVRNVSFSVNFAYVLNGWPLKQVIKKEVISTKTNSASRMQSGLFSALVFTCIL